MWVLSTFFTKGQEPDPLRPVDQEAGSNDDESDTEKGLQVTGLLQEPSIAAIVDHNHAFGDTRSGRVFSGRPLMGDAAGDPFILGAMQAGHRLTQSYGKRRS
jgi:hypothetical protein